MLHSKGSLSWQWKLLSSEGYTCPTNSNQVVLCFSSTHFPSNPLGGPKMTTENKNIIDFSQNLQNLNTNNVHVHWKTININVFIQNLNRKNYVSFNFLCTKRENKTFFFYSESIQRYYSNVGCEAWLELYKDIIITQES